MGFLLYDLATIAIPSPAAVRQWGNKAYPQHASGTGPFKIAKYVEGQVLELEPNQDYWGTKAKLAKLVLYPKPEPAARLAALQSGEVDWAEVIPPDSIEQVKAAGYNVLLKTYPHTIYYGFNTYRAPFNDVRVRQAVAYGIDRAGIVSIIQGAGSPRRSSCTKATRGVTDVHGLRLQPAEGEGAAPQAGVQTLKIRSPIRPVALGTCGPVR